MKKEVWIDGKLVETMTIDFKSVSNNKKKFQEWASNYRKKHR